MRDVYFVQKKIIAGLAAKTRMKYFSVLLASTIGLFSCSDSKVQPEVLELHQFRNPIGTLVATVEEVHNGLGLGAGMLYDEVHISNSSTSSFSHGNGDPTVAYYSESTFGKGKTPEVVWLTNDRLRIVLDPLSNPGHKEAKVGEVSVEYVVRGVRPNAQQTK
jgi:hypothetical protein